MRFPNNRWPNNLGTIARKKLAASTAESIANADRKELLAIALESRALAERAERLMHRVGVEALGSHLLTTAAWAEHAAEKIVP